MPIRIASADKSGRKARFIWLHTSAAMSKLRRLFLRRLFYSPGCACGYSIQEAKAEICIILIVKLTTGSFQGETTPESCRVVRPLQMAEVASRTGALSQG